MIRAWTLALVLVGFMLGFAPQAGAAVTTVREPAYGIPHIHADTDVELYFEYGRQVIKDRLGQFILLSRIARGTGAGLFGSGLGTDIGLRSNAYTSSELNDMFAKLPADAQAAIDAYIAGVNSEITSVILGPPSGYPIELGHAASVGQIFNIFGNGSIISDQLDPGYTPFTQFTRELAMAVTVLQTRNFGVSSGYGNEFSNFELLSRLQAKFGPAGGFAIFNDLRFLNDPLAPVSVPDPTTPGFGGPLTVQAPVSRGTMFAAVTKPLSRILASVEPATEEARELSGMLASLFVPGEETVVRPSPAVDFALAPRPDIPAYEYAAVMARLQEQAEAREAYMKKMSAWPYIGSYMWAIDGSRSKGGDPWIGGFPQTGVQTPSIMHAVELSSSEGASNRIASVGMAFVGAPAILIGHTQNVAWTTTTAGLKNTSLVAEVIVNENTDSVRYFDESFLTLTPLSKRTETFEVLFSPPVVVTFFRSHERSGNGGSRSIASFIGDEDGTAGVGSSATAVVTGGGLTAGAFSGGHVLLTNGPGAGQIREILSNDSTTLTIDGPNAFTTAPVPFATSFVAVKPGNVIIAVGVDFAFWLEESMAGYGFTLYQQAENILDVRRGVRIITTTHNFNAADNQDYNGVGTDSGSKGNIGYWSAGLSPVRQGGVDPRLPIDGTGPNPLVVTSGTVSSAGSNTLTDAGASFADLSPEPLNFAYDNPGNPGSEFIVVITSGTSYKQTRRIASNTTTTLTLEEDWGVVPAAGDTYEVMEVIATPEAINPTEGYTANWNGKASVASIPPNGRLFRHIFILERLSLESDADRAFSRQLNKDVAGINPEKIGRYILPRLRRAVDNLGDQGDSRVLPTLAALEANSAFPIDERRFIDPVTATQETQEPVFLQNWVDEMANAIYGDELAGTGASIPGGSRGRRAAVTHAIDFVAGDVPGSLVLSQDYLNGADFEQLMIDEFIDALDNLGGIPAPVARQTRSYNHPFGIPFPITTRGNRGTYQQIVQVEPTSASCGGPKGEMIFPLGQSGFISTGFVPGPNTTTLHPIWADWRHIPMLQGGAGLATNSGDVDGNGIFDAWECWHFNKTGVKATSKQNGPGDPDGDRLSNLEEYLAGSDPNDSDTDDDGVLDGFDAQPQDRQASDPRTPTVEATSDRGRGDGSGTGKGK
jgi:acyl-homoserine lactone acylase PvdQ